MPRQARKITAKSTSAVLGAGEFQETKNVASQSREIMPNTAVVPVKDRDVAGPTLTWIVPEANSCVARTARLAVVASAPTRIRSVRFYDGSRRIATVTRGAGGIYGADWRTQKAKPGRHVLRAVVLAGSARTAATRVVRVCR